jgi:TonB-dependent starch-binding outer membrane protein SusC
MIHRYIIPLLNALFFVYLPANVSAQVYASSMSEQIQSDLEKKEVSVPLRDILTKMEVEFKVSFSYENSVISNKFSTAPINSASSMESQLEKILLPLGLYFEKDKDYYFILKINEDKSPPHLRNTDATGNVLNEKTVPPEPARISQQVPVPDVTITGTVSEVAGGPLPGVNVLLKGTNTGTVTDANGRYTLVVPSATGVLVFSYIGYSPEEVLLGATTEIDVFLVPDIKTLGEIVVVGYGTQKREDLSSSVASVKSKEIENIPTVSVESALQGRLAGVQIVTNSGKPGASSFIRVRGNSTLIGANEPLIVIDGVPVSNEVRVGGDSYPNEDGTFPSVLGTLNPNDIETMDVLKDAAATAIWGARGAGGVIIITTKRGNKGSKTDLNFDSYVGVSTFQQERKLKMLNAPEYLTYVESARLNTNSLGGTLTVPNIDFQNTANLGNDTDWQDAIFRPGIVSNYNLSARGGDATTQFYLSGGVFNQEGIVIGSDLRRLSGKVNIDHKASNKLKIGTSLTISRQKTNNTGEGAGGGAIVNALRRNPNLGIKNADGSWDKNDPTGTANPVQLVEERINTDVQTRFIGNIYAELEIITGLKLRTQLSTDLLSVQTRRFTPTTIQGIAQTTALSFVANDATWLNDTYLSYDKLIADKHSLQATLGTTIQETRQNGVTAQRTGGTSNSIITANNGSVQLANEKLSEYGLLSFFGRLNYNLSEKYIVGLNFRYDGSSRFGPANQFGFFPGVSAAWLLSEESFMKSIAFISNFKIRASWGISGSSNAAGTDNYPYQGLLATTVDGINQLYGTRGAVALQRAPNPNLAWEETRQTNIGMDIALLRDRVKLTTDYYIKESDNLFMFSQYPTQTGYASATTNTGGMRNEGVEAGLTATVVEGAKFKWVSSFNFSHNTNTVTKLPPCGGAGDQRNEFIEYYAGAGGAALQPASIYSVGRPAGDFYVFNFLGVDPRTGDALYEDVDGGGVSIGRTRDRTIMGNALPLHTGGFSNEFSYSNFELAIFFSWSYGNNVYNYTRQILNAANPIAWNATTEVLDAWQVDGNITNVPRVYLSGGVRRDLNNVASSRFIEDGSFLRVRTVSLSYNFPSALFSKVGIRRAKVYVQGQNLFVFTNYSGHDPESQNQRFQAQAQLGYDNFVTPQPRTIQAGINLTF